MMMDVNHTTPHHTTPHHTTPHHTTPHHTTLLPEIRVVFLHSTDPSLDWMRRAMCLRDEELISRFVLDDKNPDYVIATDKCFINRECCAKLRHYLINNKDSIFIFFTYECLDPNLNIFDYAFTWNPDLRCGDRIGRNVPYILHKPPYIRHAKDAPASTNSLTREEAINILGSNPRFCNFIYSHASEPRDTFFRQLSAYRRIDALGPHLHNTDTEPSRFAADWYALSIGMKKGYKFSMAMENAAYRGYTTEKIISSLQAHTVPIYWGDPDVARYINPKAFINCHDYASFDEVIDRVREIDQNDDLWLDMVTQPWQTEEQYNRTLNELAEYDEFVRHIFTQDIHTARRRPVGVWGDWFRKSFTGVIGVIPPLHLRVFRRVKHFMGKLVPHKMKHAVKKFLHMA